MPYEVLDPAACVAAEPGLASARVKFAGGLRLPNDETGDCKLFTERLARICESLEVTFHYNTKIEGIRIEAGKVAGVATSRGELKADAYVAAMGSYSPLMRARRPKQDD